MAAVESGAEPRVSALSRRLLTAARALTTPLLPDDYLELLNPMWNTRELRGTIEEIRPETEDASTVVIRPFFDWQGHWPGQYLRIGVELNGVRHWRAYSLTSDAAHPKGYISITVKHVAEGRMSPYFTRYAQPGSIVYLGGAEGSFTLPHPLPDRMLFLSAGSGVTPIWSLIRNIAKRDAPVEMHHIHCCRTPDDFILGEPLRRLAESHTNYTLHEHHSGANGRITPADLDELCDDWRERHAFLSGPRELLDDFSAHWKEEGDADLLSIERFQPIIGGDATAEVGSGGTIHFRIKDFEAEADGRTSILEAGEAAGGKLAFGCRMGVCHTCTCRLESGKVRDLRTGRIHGEQGEMIRICINAPEGPVELDEGHVEMT